MSKKSILLLIIVALFALVLRLYRVSSVPASLYWDEVAIGYNAYSIYETGKDEYGTAFPFLFRSFDDYKLPGQIYLTVPFVALLGKTELAVRLPAALMGTLTVVLIYFLGRELIQRRQKLALIAALLLAISPWHLQFTRASFEAGSALFFVVLGVTLFQRALRQKKLPLFILSGVSLAASCYFYRSPVAFTPLLLGGLLLINWRRLSPKLIVVAVASFLLFYLPVAYTTMFGIGSGRLTQVGVASETFDQTVESAKLIEQQGNSPLARLLYNRRIIYATQFIKNYAASFDGNFFFVSGDEIGRHRVVGMGVLYQWEILSLLVGVVALWFHSKRTLSVLLIWFAAALVPAALSTPVPHMLRTLNMVPVFPIISGIGILSLLGILKKPKLNKVAIIGISLVVSVFFARYLFQYYVINAPLAAFFWGDPYKKLALDLEKKAPLYDRVVLTGANWQPYIYLVFYQQTDPTDFQLRGSNYGYKKYWFGFPVWDPTNSSRQLRNINLHDFSPKGENVLFVLSPEEFEHHREDINKLSVLKAKDNKGVFIFATLKK